MNYETYWTSLSLLISLLKKLNFSKDGIDKNNEFDKNWLSIIEN